MTALLAADLHLTSNPSEEERWGIFPWFRQQLDNHKGVELILAGDITDAKDRHTSRLVNRMVDEIKLTLEHADRILWIRGNHDGLDPTQPFFKFLDVLPRLHFITAPTDYSLSIGKTLLLPNTANWEEEWKSLNFGAYDFITAHQTFSGAVSETGYMLEKGIPPTIFDAVKHKAYSGDIHVPQKFGKKGEYIGAPYRTRYGDKYEGRCLLVERGPKTGSGYRQIDLHYPTKGKHVVELRTLDDLDYVKVPEGGNVKLRVKVSRADLPAWAETKQAVKAEALRRGWAVHDVELVRTDAGGSVDGTVPIRSRMTDTVAVFNQYCMAKVAPERVRTMGRAIIEQQQGRRAS